MTLSDTEEMLWIWEESAKDEANDVPRAPISVLVSAPISRGVSLELDAVTRC